MFMRLLSTVLVSAAATAACAQETAPPAGEAGARHILLTHARDRDGVSVAVQYLHLVDSNLPGLPLNVLRGRFVDGRSVALIVARPFARFDLTFGRVALEGFRLEAEGQAIGHFGVEDHLEATLSIVLRSGEIRLGRHASVNLAVANGLSYAFSDPKWERGYTFERGVDVPRLLYHIGLEAELSSPAAPGFSAFARVHHRSDAFGTFGPPWSSWNRIGGGLRYRFK